MKANVYSISGKILKETTLPQELFGRRVKPQVMAQAVRVLSSRQHSGAAQAKTRGDLTRTTAKVYAQKHTGRARHGARSAPIFVGGGVAHGPTGVVGRPLKLTKKLNRLSILGALNHLAGIQAVAFIDGLDKAKSETKTIAQMVHKVGSGKNVLLLTGQSYPQLQLAAKNVPSFSLMPATAANTLKLLKAKFLLVDQTALPKLESWLLGLEPKPEKSKTVKKTKQLAK